MATIALTAFSTMLLCVNFVLSAITYSNYAKPQFSDSKTDYDDLNSKDYYNDDEFPELPNELSKYDKNPPGGFLRSGKSRPVPKPATEAPESALATPSRPTATWIRRTTAHPEAPSNGRVIIDGSDPNTDLFEQLKIRSGPRKSTPKPKLFDADGQEIAPQYDYTKRFHVLGTVNRCKMVKQQEEIEHDGTETTVVNEDRSVTGVTAEFTLSIMHDPKIIRYRKKADGSSEFHLETIEEDLAEMTLRWYSCV